MWICSPGFRPAPLNKALLQAPLKNAVVSRLALSPRGVAWHQTTLLSGTLYPDTPRSGIAKVCWLPGWVGGGRGVWGARWGEEVGLGWSPSPRLLSNRLASLWTSAQGPGERCPVGKPHGRPVGTYGLAWVTCVSQKTEADGCRAPAGSGGVGASDVATSAALPATLLSIRAVPRSPFTLMLTSAF